jgi:hypothetical protein
MVSRRVVPLVAAGAVMCAGAGTLYALTREREPGGCVVSSPHPFSSPGCWRIAGGPVACASGTW